jgi:hypothetical protein
VWLQLQLHRFCRFSYLCVYFAGFVWRPTRRAGLALCMLCWCFNCQFDAHVFNTSILSMPICPRRSRLLWRSVAPLLSLRDTNQSIFAPPLTRSTLVCLLPDASTRIWLEQLSLAGVLCIHACQAFVPAPVRFPDLWTVAVVTYSCAHFVLALVYGTWMQCHLVEEKEWDAPFYRNNKGHISTRRTSQSSTAAKPKTE